MATRQLPSPEVLRQLLRYEPDTGKLFWKERGPEWFSESSYAGRATRTAEWACAVWNNRNAGKQAFTADNGKGYRAGTIFGVKLKAHRVCFAILTGEWPPEQVDHINGDPRDNRACNLRLAGSSQNAWNKGPYARNRTGLKGVSFKRQTKRWSASIKAHGKQRHLGYFETPEMAHAAYVKAALDMHGEYARTT